MIRSIKRGRNRLTYSADIDSYGINYDVVEFICDNESDVQDLPTTLQMSSDKKFSQCSAGSTALVLETNKIYVLNTEDIWSISSIESSGGGGEGSVEQLRGVIDKTITELTVPDGTTGIGSYLFAMCSNLAHVTLPDSITYIGTASFGGCVNLEEIELPDSITSILDEAFSYCAKLNFTELPSKLTQIPNACFRGCQALSIYKLPDNLVSIQNYAFYDCANISISSLPNTLEFIGTYAFYNCTKLAITSIPENITEIEESCFNNCTSLENITLGSKVTSIGTRAFAGCTNLKSITCYATTPPSIVSNTFENVPYTCIVYVPGDSINAYRSSQYWGSKFKTMLPIEE